MDINRHKMLMSFACICSMSFSIASISSHDYIIKSLDFHNQKEIQQVLEIFQSDDVQEMTNQSAQQIQVYINFLYYDETQTNRDTILVYQDKKSHKIQGILRYKVDSYENRWNTYIGTIATHKNFRRKKIASCLLLQAEQIARNYGCDTIYLHVYPENYTAVQCYEKQGFEITTEHEAFVTMSKNLTFQ